MPRPKGRGAREHNRAERRQTYAAAIAPALSEHVQIESPADRALLVGDDLEPLAYRLATLLPDGAVALVVPEYERWDAARTALAAHANVTVVQELSELDDPDGFDMPPWTLGVLLVPSYIGPKSVYNLIGEMVYRLATLAPIYAGGARNHDWKPAQERLSALAGPLTLVFTSEPVRIVRGAVRPRAGVVQE